MPSIFLYILKLSACLSVVFLFYHLVLRKLTFYTWNRFYLLGFTLLSFFIPLIDISPIIAKSSLQQHEVISWIPVLYQGQAIKSPLGLSDFLLNGWNLLLIIFSVGMLWLFIRLMLQLFSYRRMVRRAKLIHKDSIKVYLVDDGITPFSFGHAVFINQHMQTKEELEAIIQHEFIHVRQQHSIDIMWGELFIIFNWFNPFTWMLKNAIRQNLEYFADCNTLKIGINKQEYQYLLLKVIGNNQFSIVSTFNFHSLTKRIAMMNKNKSAKVNLLRFLFLLPLIAIVLVSFRKQIKSSVITSSLTNLIALPSDDTVPHKKKQPSSRYDFRISAVGTDTSIIIIDKNNRKIDTVLLNDWKTTKKEYYTNLYGELPPPPPPLPPAPPPVPKQPKSSKKTEITFDPPKIIRCYKKPTPRTID